MLKKAISLTVAVCMLFTGLILYQQPVKALEPSEYAFSGPMTQKVMESYLSKAATIQNFVWFYTDNAQKNEWLRFISNTGTKFIHRSSFTWDDYSSSGLGDLFYCVVNMANAVHMQDSECILEACIFETVSTSVNTLPIPSYVFTEFGLPVESRNFNYTAMLYSDGRYVNHWGTGCSIPDITKTETQMLYYYLARRYIDSGIEAVNFSQTMLIGELDPFYCNFNSLFKRIRTYAASNARRYNVLVNSHNFEIVDNCDPLWYSAKGDLVYETGNTQNYYNGDYSKINRANTTQTQDGSYIIYKLDNITSFNIQTANGNHYGELPSAYDIYTSTNGRDWTLCSYTSTEIFRYDYNWPNYRMTNTSAIPTGTKYLKISWKVLAAHWLAQLMNVQISSSTSSITDTMDQPSPQVKKLALDFLEYPLRMNGVSGQSPNTVLEVNHIDSIYQKVAGGLNPQGFMCSANPYLVEFDNYGGNNGNPGVNADYWPWGYDEITWYALQSSDYRRSWLKYAFDWLAVNDPNGHVSMPVYRNYLKQDGTWSYYNAINVSTVYPGAFGDEDTIKNIFSVSGPVISNIVKSSSFELGSSSWTLPADFSVSNQSSYAGTYSLKLTGDWDNCKAYQTISVTPNTNYSLTFFGKCNASTDFNVYNSSWVNLANSSTWANNTWTMYQLEFNSGNNSSIILSVTDNGGTGTSYFDDFSIVKNENKVQNSGFETGSSSPWTVASDYSLNAANSHYGAYSLCLTGNGDNSKAYQTITVSQNTDYTLTFYGKCNATNEFNVYSGSWANIASSNVTSNNTWTRYKLNFNSGSNTSIIISITDNGSIGTSYYDDFSVLPSVNLIIDSGLESGKAPWLFGTHFSLSTTEKRSGSCSLKVQGTWDNCNAFQYIAVTPNTNYNLSFYGKCNAASTYKVMNQSWSSNLSGDRTVTANNTWTKYTASFNSGNNSLIVLVICDNSSSSYTSYYDDFILY